MATAPTATPAAGASLPTPPSTSDPANFDVRADAFFTALPGLQVSENALSANVYANALGAYSNALEVANNTASVSANTALAAGYAGATVWVSGTTYALNDIRYSPTDRRLYRRIVAGAGTTDPNADFTNWAVVSPAQAALLVSNLVQQAISGSTYAFTNTTSQSAATNLLTYSIQQDNAAWTKASATVSADFTMSPSGDVNADKIVEVAATATHSTAQAATTAANQPYTFSIYAKSAGRTSMSLRMDKDSLMADYVNAKFDLSTGATSSVTNTGTASGATATATYVGNGWWLCSLTGTPASSAGTAVRCSIGVIDFASNVGDGSSGISVSHAQLETGSVYTSRIDSGASQGTRASGVVAPQRLVLPLSPAADAYARLFSANGIDTNIIDPNGQTIMGISGPMKIDNSLPQSIALQFVNSSWRLV